MTDRIVAISGAAGGLGPVVARAFFDAGAKLAVAGRNEESLGRLLDSLGAPGDRRLATAADLTDETAVRAWAGRVRERFGGVDVVLHLVGGYKGGASIAEIETADWDALHAMLVRTTLNVARAFNPLLKASGRGRFIGVTSPRAQSPTAKSALYSMGKAASDALVLALADELRGTGSTANLIVVDSIDGLEEEIAAAMLFLCSDRAATINGVRLPLTGRG